MTPDRISELLVPFSAPALSDQQLNDLQIYLLLLLKWNAKINLTAVREPDEIVARHFGESIFAAQYLFPSVATGLTAIDVGSGAGFPGIPIKLLRPEIQMTLIESNQRKATFLREVIRALGLSDINVSTSRAESISIQADLVTLRAVENFDQVLPTANRLVKPKGRLALLIGESQTAAAKLALPNLEWEESVSIPLSRSRIVLVGRH